MFRFLLLNDFSFLRAQSYKLLVVDVHAQLECQFAFESFQSFWQHIFSAMDILKVYSFCHILGPDEQALSLCRSLSQ